MKSIQWNYFASGDDLLRVAEVILDWCPELVVFPPRGPSTELSGRRVNDARSLLPESPGEKHLLCAVTDASRIFVTNIDSQVSCIQTLNNPVVEYSPSACIDKQTAKIGRFYANYGDLGFLRRVRQLFRKLNQEAMRLDNSGLWIFANAARTKRFLRPWAGPDWDNPFFNR